MRHFASFTDKERRLLEAWLQLIDEGFRANLDEKAAGNLGISPVTVRTRKSRMRSKYELALEFCREYRGFQQRIFQGSGGKFNPLGRTGRTGKKKREEITE